MHVQDRETKNITDKCRRNSEQSGGKIDKRQSNIKKCPWAYDKKLLRKQTCTEKRRAGGKPEV